MTEKEKAKAYDKDIERAKKLYGNGIVEEIFSELKEDDTERIKKDLIQWVDDFPDIIWRDHYKKDIIAWLEKQGEQALSQTNERAWLYLVSDVLTWKDGIGQYLDDPRVQELAKRLCSDYAQKLYNPSNSSNTGKNEQKSSDKIEPRFNVGDWVVRGDTIAQILDIQEQYYVGLDINGKDFVSSRFLNDDKIHIWTLQDAKDGNVVSFYSDYKGKKMFQIGIVEKYVGKIGCCSNTFKTYVGMDWDNNLHIGRYMGCDDIQPATK